MWMHVFHGEMYRKFDIVFIKQALHHFDYLKTAPSSKFSMQLLQNNFPGYVFPETNFEDNFRKYPGNVFTQVTMRNC